MSDPDAARLAAALGRPQRHGKGWRCLCPAHDDAHPSLDIDPGSNGRLLFQCRAGCDNGAVMAALRSRGLWPPPDVPPRRNGGNGPHTPDRSGGYNDPSGIRHARYGLPGRIYRYWNAAGELAGVVCRWEATPAGPPGPDEPAESAGPDGAAGSPGEPKRILPYVHDGRRWVNRAMPAPRPLYRLPDLLRRDDAQVLVVEGEKNADDAADLLGDLVTVTWAGGAKALHQTDWTPLAGRRVVLWPDNDEPGHAAMAKLAGLLVAAGGDPTIIKILRRDPDKRKGWDISDAIREDGWDVDRIIEYARERAEAWIDTDAAFMAEHFPGETDVSVIAVTRQPTPPAGGATVVQFRPREQAAPDQAVAPDNSEDRIAIEVCRRHGHELRHVAQWGKWFQWCGTHWREEHTLLAFDTARRVAREFAAAAEIFKPGTGKSIAQSKTWAGVTRAVAADRRVATTAEAWDTDKWLLNTPGGTVNLRTGEMRPSNPDDHITKITASAPDFEAETPVWSRFLSRITDGNDELVAFLRRMSGYSLTAETREHALFFLYGLGANGKSTFINALSGCMGDYAISSPIETFTEQKNDKHLTEIARLRGARLVTATETSEGRRWNDSRINQLTAGDKVSANFMRQDLFEFVPTFKLVIAGNHKPGLRSVTEAVRRRFNLIPFTASIPVEERDQELPDKLRAEWPGILAWAISGCIEWQEMRLRAPVVVMEATAEYLEAEDAFVAWSGECCEQVNNHPEAIADLYLSWCQWAKAAGEHEGSMKRFSQTVANHGYETRKGTHGKRVAVGLRLTKSASDGNYNDFYR